MISIKLPWPPTVNTYWQPVMRAGGRGKKYHPTLVLSERGRKYKQAAYGYMLEQHIKTGLEGRVEVTIDAYPPDRRKRDLDNILKPLLDCIEEFGVVINDEQIDILTIRRHGKDEEGGYVHVRVWEIEEHERLTA